MNGIGIGKNLVSSARAAAPCAWTTGAVVTVVAVLAVVAVVVLFLK